MLTPQGMRQRYLLGKYNFNKYSNALGEQSLMNTTNLSVESTDVYRTMQSGYSELFGMLQQQAPPRLQLSETQEEALVSNTRGMPAFNVRNASQIEAALNQNAIEEGFVNVPLHNYINFVYEDDLGYGSCKYSMGINNIRTPVDPTYANVLYTREELADAYATDF